MFVQHQNYGDMEMNIEAANKNHKNKFKNKNKLKNQSKTTQISKILFKELLTSSTSKHIYCVTGDFKV